MEKKNKKRLGIVVVMLVLILAIGATAGTTLAKYISSASATDTATVAKWGYTLSANTDKMFGKQYGDELKTIDAKNFAGVNSSGKLVVSSSVNKLVAPGAAGYMTFTLSGSAEVASRLVIEIDSTSFKTVSLTGNETSYYPIKWAARVGAITDLASLNGASWSTTNVTTAAELATALQTGVVATKNSLPSGVTVLAVDGTKIIIEIPANTTFDSVVLAIAWKWDFEVNDATNKSDTILGYFAAGKTAADTVNGTALAGYTAALNVEVKATATFEQIQAFTPNP